MTDDLIVFLRARLDEDERIARAARLDGVGHWQHHGYVMGADVSGDHEGYHVAFDEGYPTLEQAIHIAAHDPARVLREVEAKRRVVEWYATRVGLAQGDDADDWENVTGQTLETVARGLAAVYADHPDYRQEWAA